MKRNIIFLSAILFLLMMGCGKDQLPSPTGGGPGNNVPKFSGNYSGLFNESDNGVDSNGVFKNDTSYMYSLKVTDVGGNQVEITHGPIALPIVTLDASNHFSFEDFNHNITGYFVNDSMYLSSSSLNGVYDSLYYVGSWFVIQKLTFAGKKEL